MREIIDLGKESFNRAWVLATSGGELKPITIKKVLQEIDGIPLLLTKIIYK